MVYIPSGLAHGFCALSENFFVIYKLSKVYTPEHDLGIRWNSLNIPWEVDDPNLSERDKLHPVFSDFVSPFEYL